MNIDNTNKKQGQLKLKRHIDVENNLQFIQEVQELAKEYEVPFIIATDNFFACNTMNVPTLEKLKNYHLDNIKNEPNIHIFTED